VIGTRCRVESLNFDCVEKLKSLRPFGGNLKTDAAQPIETTCNFRSLNRST
jgi:hypothetical protein